MDESGLVAQLAVMSRGLWASPTRNTVALLVVALFIVIAATAYGQIRLNGWNQPFYDALSRRDFPRFVFQLGVFGIIAGALLALNVAQRWLGEMMKLKLRQGLVQDLVQNWLVPARAFRIATPEYGFVFIRLEGERRLLTLTPRDPYSTASQSFSPFRP